MASAKKIVPPTTVVSLLLNHEEARTLRLILSLVGGHPDRSRRGHADAISAALESVGYTDRNVTTPGGALGGITFDNLP